MQETLRRYNIEQFLPKFSQVTRRLAQPYSDNILIRNLLIHAEYKCRWRVVKDLQDVFVRFNQVIGWYQQYSVQQHPQLLQKQLEYLHTLILEQFDTNVQSSMLAAYKSHLELSPAALRQDSTIMFYYKGMKRIFLKEGVVALPHIVIGNKIRFSIVGKLLDYLFLQDNG